MKTNKLKSLLLTVIGATTLACGQMHAQTVAAPELDVYNFNDQSRINALSDNGRWAVSYGSSMTDDSRYTNARVINVETKEVTALGLEGDATLPAQYMANDVTDDGLVVGMNDEKPAIWTKAGGWIDLPVPAGWTAGAAWAVTPDGKWAVGYMYNYGGGSENYGEYPVLWNLTTMQMVETPNHPTVGSNNEKARMVRYTSISADGRYIGGIVDYSYTWNSMSFMYDREAEGCIRMGFDADGTPWVDGLLGLDGMFSPNGKWFAGMAVMAKGEFDETTTPCRYNVETKELELFSEDNMSDFVDVLIDNNGTLFASTPSGTPIRSLYVRAGKFWYAMDELLSQACGIDFYGKTGFDNTGTVMGISGDGKTLTAFPDPYKSYILRMNETFVEAASRINLLASYTVTPANGVSFSQMKTVKLTFSRDVKVLGETSDIKFTDENGNAVSARILSFAASGNVVTIGFRTLTLEGGKKYVLTIPAGTIALNADQERTNDEIVLTYTGRGEAPVKVTEASPEAGSALTQLNATTNPVLLTFDTDIALTDNAAAGLYREGSDEEIAPLSIAVKDNQMLIYPETTQYLYLNTNYKVVLNAGSVTDVNGSNANERYEIVYEGLYERIVLADDTLMYKEDFANGVNGMMLYDGDKNIPNEEMQALDFYYNNTPQPWIPVREAVGDANYSAASTSAYSPAGKSDDWMVTPQIYLPDHKCRLEFQAQGYRKYKQDKLKVIVYASEAVLNYFDEEEAAEFRANGEVLMDEVVSPGQSEDNLSGDWTTYSFKLEKYAGKNIYVAFVNENEDQSIVFIDDVKVVRDNGFLTALTSATTVVGQNSQKIEGRIIANSATQTFSDISIKLLDGDKKVVDEIAETGLALKKGDRYDFSFAKELPLAIGEINTFYFRVQLGEEFDTIRYTVKDLAFQPTKRVVVEEYTGMDCGNCPRGHLAFENLERIYGDKVIPVGYHVYTGDIYESGMTSYAQNFLGLNGAPSAKVQRGETIGNPMYNSIVAGKSVYSYTSPTGDCWFDLVQKEFDTDADANLDIAAYYNEATSQVSVDVAAKFAMNMDKQNIGLFLVVTEDGLTGYQHNYHSQDESEGLGEWGKGGTLGSEYVPYTHNDVARAHVGYYNGTTGYIPSAIVGGEVYKAQLAFDKPTVNEIYNCKVVCMMIDANTGTVINVARAKIVSTDGINGVTASDANASEVVRYNAAGQVITAPAKGLNIIRMSDGTIKKVMVK